MARNKLSWGTSANDRTGTLLNNGTQFIEEALRDIYLFLSGGVSDVELPITLPRNKGGTGAASDIQLQNVVATYGAKAFALGATNKEPVGKCIIGFGRIPKLTVYKPESFNEQLYCVKRGVGHYHLNVVSSNVGIDSNYVYVRPDNMGNQRVGAAVQQEGQEIDVYIHPLVFNNGLFELDTSTLVDVPEDTYISFVLSNQILNSF